MANSAFEQGTTGDTTGAPSSTDNAIARMDGTTGKVIQNSTVIVSDGGNIAQTLSGTTEAHTITSTSTGRALFIDQNGDTGANLIDSGAIVIDNTDNSGIGFQLYTNGTQAAYGPMLLYAANTSNNNPLLRIIHKGTGGGAAHIRLDGPSPQIEFVEDDQSTPAGKFEVQVQGDIFFVNGRNSADNSFENSVWFLRPQLGGNVGIGVNPYNIEKLTLGETTGGSARIALAETTAPTADVGYGKVYVKSSDSNLYFMNDSGTETQLNTGGASGITRSVTVTSGSFTAGAAALTDYIYLLAGAHVPTLPTAVGNTNRYTLKNNHSANITVLTTSSQTVDGGTLTIAPSESVDLISNNINWNII